MPIAHNPLNNDPVPLPRSLEELTGTARIVVWRLAKQVLTDEERAPLTPLPTADIINALWNLLVKKNLVPAAEGGDVQAPAEVLRSVVASRGAMITEEGEDPSEEGSPDQGTPLPAPPPPPRPEPSPPAAAISAPPPPPAATPASEVVRTPRVRRTKAQMEAAQGGPPPPPAAAPPPPAAAPDPRIDQLVSQVSEIVVQLGRLSTLANMISSLNDELGRRMEHYLELFTRSNTTMASGISDQLRNEMRSMIGDLSEEIQRIKLVQDIILEDALGMNAESVKQRLKS